MKILLLWYMEDDNYGDVLIYDTVKTRLEERGYETESHEVGDKVENIIEHGNKCDFILFAGGGIIERGIPDVIVNIKKFIAGIKSEYGVMGLGIGRFDYSDKYEALNIWVNQSNFFYVRDEFTQNELNKISHSNKVIFSADCVFANKRINEIAKINQNMDSKDKGINVRDIPYKDISRDLQWDKINEIKEKYEINLILPDASKDISNIIFDESNKKIIEMYRNLNKIDKIEYTTEKILRCQWILAMRFHVILVAAMLGIPSVSIKYCPKVEFLVEQLGLHELAVKDNEEDKISEKINSLLNDKDNIVKNMNCNVEIMKTKSERMFEEVMDKLDFYFKNTTRS